jgi:hypothetical protein
LKRRLQRVILRIYSISEYTRCLSKYSLCWIYCAPIFAGYNTPCGRPE